MAFIEGDTRMIVRDPLMRRGALNEALSIMNETYGKAGIPTNDRDRLLGTMRHPSRTRGETRHVIATAKKLSGFDRQ